VAIEPSVPFTAKETVSCEDSTTTSPIVTGRISTINAELDGGSNVIDHNTQFAIQRVGFDCRITKVTIVAGGGIVGSCVINIYRSSFSEWDTQLTTIVAASKPEIVVGIKYEDSLLLNWQRDLPAGSILLFDPESLSNFKYLLISLDVTRT
jgi:hypothetical protein